MVELNIPFRCAWSVDCVNWTWKLKKNKQFWMERQPHDDYGFVKSSSKRQRPGEESNTSGAAPVGPSIATQATCVIKQGTAAGNDYSPNSPSLHANLFFETALLFTFS